MSSQARKYTVSDLVRDSRAAGFEVHENPDGLIHIVSRRHKGTGEVLVGVTCSPWDGWCLDPTVDKGVARSFRPIAAKKHLAGAKP
jgi:hypothetical protein